MCLALPAEIVSLDREKDTAIVSLGGIKKEISIALLEELAVGDFVLVHVGFALHKVSPEEADRTLAMIKESGEDPLEEFAA
ncbi:hydrogenase assembly chaperone HypC/HupF [Hyphomicrobium denitrificans 1NES1]|uniref:Hydrogenase maturation factor HypC n=1 Tax=Hyphomicrobium denitrificans 1NES1 TaxID=670307 RepID=N0B2W8_9HYPH|nr:HypC/HybG/HupF family hydrogenase formation chaperone [Hyphomicrobium denitrificans]AGK57348.1 hydrogenase assembly chaperone HypC/HupF [Hyphomicrobium denitrificans 1NES1]